MRLSETASGSMISGKLSLGLSWCLEVRAATWSPGALVFREGLLYKHASTLQILGSELWSNCIYNKPPLGTGGKMDFWKRYVRKGSRCSWKMGYFIPLHPKMCPFQLRHFNSNGELSCPICRAAPLDFSFVNGSEISPSPSDDWSRWPEEKFFIHVKTTHQVHYTADYIVWWQK